MASGRGKLGDDAIMIITCDRMHWDYHTYLAQPVWFVEMLLTKWMVDNSRKAQDSP